MDNDISIRLISTIHLFSTKRMRYRSVVHKTRQTLTAREDEEEVGVVGRDEMVSTKRSPATARFNRCYALRLPHIDWQ